MKIAELNIGLSSKSLGEISEIKPLRLLKEHDFNVITYRLSESESKEGKETCLAVKVELPQSWQYALKIIAEELGQDCIAVVGFIGRNPYDTFAPEFWVSPETPDENPSNLKIENKQNKERNKDIKRDCCFNYSKDHKSVICHSAAHRSTFQLSINATTTVFPKNGNPYQRAFKNCRDAFRAFWYWSKQEQTAINVWIEAIQVGASLNTANRLACIASRPLWTFTEQTRKGFRSVSATRPDGALTIKQSADSWSEIHFLTRH